MVTESGKRVHAHGLFWGNQPHIIFYLGTACLLDSFVSTPVVFPENHSNYFEPTGMLQIDAATAVVRPKCSTILAVVLLRFYEFTFHLLKTYIQASSASILLATVELTRPWVRTYTALLPNTQRDRMSRRFTSKNSCSQLQLKPVNRRIP